MIHWVLPEASAPATQSVFLRELIGRRGRKRFGASVHTESETGDRDRALYGIYAY